MWQWKGDKRARNRRRGAARIREKRGEEEEEVANEARATDMGELASFYMALLFAFAGRGNRYEPIACR